MLIYYILPYLAPPPFEEQRYDRIYRERQMVLYTKSLGMKCELIFLSYHPEIMQQDNDVQSWILPAVNPYKHDNTSHISKALLSKIEQDKPDLVIFKGLGFLFSRWLIPRCKHKFRFAFISAGGSKDILAPFADYILAETQQQIDDNFQEQQRQGRVAILPKLNLPGSFQTSSEKEFDVINVGNFIAVKNQEALIPLARDFRVAMIGDGELFSRVRDKAELYKDNIYMPGNLPREQIPSLIARSRLMVHPAHHEGLARVVMEAFACGVPVVASKRAMPNAFEHGVHGLLVEPEEIVPAARELLSDEARLQKMGKNAYQYAKENCSEEAVYKVTKKMYDKVFSEPPAFDHTLKNHTSIKLQSAYISGIKKIKRFGRYLGMES